MRSVLKVSRKKIFEFFFHYFIPPLLPGEARKMFFVSTRIVIFGI